VLWRLTDPGDTVIDVGANIGYMTSIMSVRVGKTGRVICFEPHPQIYNELYRNVKHWQKMYDWNHIETYLTALSDVKGKGFLKAPLENNLGTASLIQFDSVDGSVSYREDRINIHKGNAGHNGYIVLKDRLDNKLEKLKVHQVDVLKIDVEGHELQVLKGVERLLSRKAIRDIFFEDSSCYWRPTGEFLKDFDVLSDNGYMIFKISKGFLKPLLDSPHKFIDLSQNFDPINYLATIDPDRAVHRLQNNGWSSLWCNS